jgi:hypothetical protein
MCTGTEIDCDPLLRSYGDSIRRLRMHPTGLSRWLRAHHQLGEQWERVRNCYVSAGIADRAGYEEAQRLATQAVEISRLVTDVTGSTIPGINR